MVLIRSLDSNPDRNRVVEAFAEVLPGVEAKLVEAGTEVPFGNEGGIRSAVAIRDGRGHKLIVLPHLDAHAHCRNAARGVEHMGTEAALRHGAQVAGNGVVQENSLRPRRSPYRSWRMTAG